MVFIQTFENFTLGFREWFGNSKLVNKKGEPMIMYHGSPHMFDTFNPDLDYYFFTSSILEAKRYVDVPYKSNMSHVEEENKRITKYYIKAENIFDPTNMNEKEKKEVYKIIKDNLRKFYLLLPDFSLSEYNEDYLNSSLIEEELLNPSDDLIYEHLIHIITNNCDNYILLETQEIQEWIKSNNYDSFVTIESGEGLNIAVYNINQIWKIN
jgi:hypothetical protein